MCKSMDGFQQDNHIIILISVKATTYMLTHTYTQAYTNAHTDADIQIVCCNFKATHTNTEFAQHFTGSHDGINHGIFRNKLYLYVAIKIST